MIAIILGVLFENQNIAFMVGLAFAIAASCNFPIILLSMYWSKLTTRGAMLGGWLGLITAVVLMILGPTIWVQILGHEKPFSRMNTRRCSLSAWHSSVSGSSRQRIIQRKVRASVNCSVRSLSAPRLALALSRAARINLPFPGRLIGEFLQNIILATSGETNTINTPESIMTRLATTPSC